MTGGRVTGRLRRAGVSAVAVTLLAGTALLDVSGAGASTSTPTPPSSQGQNGPPAGITALGEGAAPSPGRDVIVYARATSPGTVPGGSAGFFVVVSNSGKDATPDTSPTTIVLTIPDGMTFSSVTDLSGPSAAGAVWNCAPSSANPSAVTCTWGVALPDGSVRPAPIAGASAISSFVELKVDQNFAATTSGVDRTLKVGLFAPDNNATSDQSTSAKITVVVGKPSADFFPDVSGSASVGVGDVATEKVRLLNVGSGPAEAAGGEPTVRLDNLLPKRVLGEWQASGTDWTCSGATNAPPTCDYTAPRLVVGALTSSLILTYHLDPVAVASLKLAPGAAADIEKWTIGITGHEFGRPLAQSYPAQIAITPPAGANLVVTATVAHGLDELVPGTATSVDVRIANIGAVATSGKLVVTGSLPVGVVLRGTPTGSVATAAAAGSDLPWTCAAMDRAFACSPTSDVSIAPSADTHFRLNLDASPDVKTGDGIVFIQASAQNESVDAASAKVSVPLVLLPDNAGFPSLSLLRAAGRATLATASNGAPASMLTGMTFTERLDVVDSGGAPISAGSDATLSQNFTKGVRIRSVQAPPGEHCATTTAVTPSLQCSVTFSAALDPRATLSGPTVTLAVTESTNGVANWSAGVRLSGANAPPEMKTDVLVTVKSRAPDLVTALAAAQLPSAGGTGTWRVSISNHGDAPTAKVIEATITFPRGTVDAHGEAKGWTCSARLSFASGSPTVSCEQSVAIGAGRALAPIVVGAVVPKGDSSRSFTVSATASAGGFTPPTAKDAMTVVVRNAVHAVIKAPASVVFDIRPPTSMRQPIRRSTVTLGGDGSGGNSLGLTYTWTQRCTTAADVSALGSRCAIVTPIVRWINQPTNTTTPHSADVTFRVPAVKVVTPLVFELTVSDGSTTSSAFTRIRVVPPTRARKGFVLVHPHPKATPSAGPSTETAKLPAPAEKLKTKRATSAKTTDSLSSAASSPIAAVLSGDRTSVAPTSKSAAKTSSVPTHAQETTTTTPSGLSTVFCSLLDRAVGGAGFTTNVAGGITITFANPKLSGSGCASDSTLEFSDSSLKIGSVFSATGVAGTVGASGIHFTAGTLSGPAAWNSPSFSLSGSGGGTGTANAGATSLVVEYTPSDGLAVSGSVTASGLAFLPLPSGWTSSTTLTFAASTSGTSIDLVADATGPSADTSPNSSPPKISINGTVALDGTFSLSASLTNFVQLQGSAINLTGKIARTTASGSIDKTMTGTLASPIRIVKGLSISSLTITATPTVDSLGLSGAGVVAIVAGSTSFDINVSFAYSNLKNWSLTATGSGQQTWTPIPGLTVRGSDVRGSISASNDAYQFSLTFSSQSQWTPKSGVTVSNLVLSVSDTCPDSGAPCPTDASLFLRAAGDVSLNLPVVGAAQARLSGVLAIPTGAFSVEAALTAPLSLAAGVSIDSAKVEMSRGFAVPAGTGTPAIDTQDPSGLSISVQGAVTIPKIGSLPSVVASWSASGWALAANLGNYALPGVSGNGTQLTDTILGWASFPTSLSVVDPVTKVKTSIPLPADTFEVSGSYAAPDWFKSLFKLSSDAKGRATGSLDLSNGDFALKMSVTAAPDWYLYGGAGTSTNLRLDTVYFNIEHKGPDFSTSLGGTVAMVAPGIPTVSPLEFGVALGFSTTGPTLAGTLSLKSRAGWQDAFGFSGLTLSNLTIAFGLNLSTLTPTLGVGATAILPAAIRDPLGMPANVKTTIVANISLSNPCLGIEVTDPTNSGQNVLDIGSGAFTAKQLLIQVAPSGCTVGEFHYDPGISLNFKGAIVGVAVEVAATLSVSPFKLNANLDVGAFSVAGVDVDHTKITVAVSPAKFAISFEGGIHVLGTAVAVTGALSQNGAVSTIDFHGALDNLSLGSVLNIKKATVDAHVVTGPTPSVKFGAAGTIDLLGSTVDASFSLNIDNGQLVEVRSNINANITIGGSNGVNLAGTFKLDYGPAIPFVINADVAVKVGGYSLAHATALLNSSGFTLTADFSLGSVFTAQIVGTLFYSTPPSGTTITGPTGATVVAKAGDFLFSARDVSINLAGFKATGSVSLGRANGSPWGSLSTTIQLLGGASGNAISIAGSFSGNGDFSLSGTGTLSLLGIGASVTASVTKTGPNVAVSGSTTLSVLGSNIYMAGDFNSNNGSPQFRLTGSGELNVGGFRFASAKVFFSNFPQDAGLAASIDSRIGSVLTLAGKLSIQSGNRFYLGVNANLDLKVLSTSASVVLTNCVYTYTVTYINFFFFKIPIYSNPVCSSAGATNLDAKTTFDSAGFSFGVSVHIDSNGNFKATAYSPSSGGTYHGETDALYLAVVAFYATFSYRMSATVESSYPYLSVSGEGSADIYGKTWDIGFWYARWGGWGHIIGVSASIQTNPFHVCGSARVWGTSFGPACI